MRCKPHLFSSLLFSYLLLQTPTKILLSCFHCCLASSLVGFLNVSYPKSIPVLCKYE
uniref:Uncharacterized protein n=1 Tax=Manihot esculenta TaxID=3983 RepID=A0A2C9VQA0_MANES